MSDSFTAMKSTVFREKGRYCNVCGMPNDKHRDEYGRNVHIHHKDGDRSNNDLENLIPLCEGCHRKVHNGWASGGKIAELQELLPSTGDDTSKVIKGEADNRVNYYLKRIQDEHDLNKYDAVTFALEKARARQLGVSNDE